MAPPVFKTGLAANIVAGGFDSLPPPPLFFETKYVLAARLAARSATHAGDSFSAVRGTKRSQRPVEEFCDELSNSDRPLSCAPGVGVLVALF